MINLFKKLFSRQTPIGQHNDCDIDLYEDLYPSDDVNKTVFDENNIDLGHGYIARRLINGMWVLWNVHSKSALDLVKPNYHWRPGDSFWTSCYGDLSTVKSYAVDAKAFNGTLINGQNINS